MAITKTDFINLIRCPRYASFEEIRKDKLLSNMTISEYKEEEKSEIISEIIDSMFSEEDGKEIDLTLKHDKQLEAMQGYYKEVELLAAQKVERVFGGESIYSEETYRQESFDFEKNGIRYLCFVDIYNESNDEINIIEVKSCSSRSFNSLEYFASRSKEKYPLFSFNGGIYYLNKKDINELNEKKYLEKLAKLKNKYDDCGRYVYDLSVQRYIIENDFKNRNINKKVNYFLAVLNHEYVYDGYKEDGKRIYRKDTNGNEIIKIFNMNEITEEMMNVLDSDRKRVENYIFSSDPSKCKVGVYCSLKKRTECKYKNICFKNVPKYNASYNYIDFRSFKDENGVSYDKYDLINDGYFKFDDVPRSWLKNEKHIIQRDAYDYDIPYVDKDKIRKGIEYLKYPIYHLDFESFPCPIPRFRGEKPYSQSCFEFSLHIEKAPGICDKKEDNFIFLAKTLDDEREELVKALIKNIDPSKGMMLAQNVSFEKTRIKELSVIFPEYKEKLMQIYDIGFDLLYIIENKEDLYLELGFDEKRSKLINYYNKNQSGSYSIKKTLPLFTDLKYSDLEIQNGTDALVQYSLYEHMTHKERQKTYENLSVYCCQDTWAMVEILKGLRDLVK